jgi:hypothetical protein
LRHGRIVKKPTGDTYHYFYTFSQPVGYALGKQINSIRAELSSGFVHSHPRPLGKEES